MAEVTQKRSRFPKGVLLVVVLVVCGVALYVSSFFRDEPVAEVIDGFSLTGKEIVALEQEQITLYTQTGEEGFVIETPRPSELVWSEALDQIFWVEEKEQKKDESLFSVRSFATQTHEQTTLYWTDHAITHMALSSNAVYLAFLEQGDLYVLDRSDRAVRRLIEDVEEFQWAPTTQALIVRLAETTKLPSQYIPLNQKGEIASRVDLHSSEESMLGFAFVDDTTIAAIKTTADEDAFYIQLNLSSQKEEVTIRWTGDVAARSRVIRINEEQNTAVVVERSEESATTWVCRLITRQCQQAQTDVELLGWNTEDTYLFTREAMSDSRYTDIFVYDTITQTERTYATNLMQPVSLNP